MALSGEKFDGDSLAITWDSSTIEAELIRSVTVSRTRKKSEKTGAGDSAIKKHPHKWDYALAIEIWKSDQDVDDADIFIESDEAVTFTIYPNGNTAGEISLAGSAFLDSISEVIPTGDSPGMVALSITADVDGAITRSTVSS